MAKHYRNKWWHTSVSSDRNALLQIKKLVLGDATRDLLISGDVPVLITLTMSANIKAVHQDTGKVPLNWPLSYANKEEARTRNINEMKTSPSPLLPEVDKSCRATMPAALDKFLLEEYWWLPWVHKLDGSWVRKKSKRWFPELIKYKIFWMIKPAPQHYKRIFDWFMVIKSN